ncbi:MAG: SMI1/KNR4 family protein [Candidatus Binatia bacterium]
MNHTTEEQLRSHFTRFPFLVGGEVSEQEIENAERELGRSFPPAYREFVLRFGGGVVGSLSIAGLRFVPAMGSEERSVIELTRRFQEDGWAAPDWLVISIDHGGNPLGLAKDGSVWRFDHDFGGLSLVSETFDDFVAKQCFRERS